MNKFLKILSYVLLVLISPIFLPIILVLLIIIPLAVYNIAEYTFGYSSQYSIAEKVEEGLNIDVPIESECVNHFLSDFSFEQTLGLTEFKLSTDYDLLHFIRYTKTKEYNSKILKFIYELYQEDILNTDEYYDYYQYIFYNEGYVLEGSSFSYGLYYPEDYKVIVVYKTEFTLLF